MDVSLGRMRQLVPGLFLIESLLDGESFGPVTIVGFGDGFSAWLQKIAFIRAHSPCCLFLQPRNGHNIGIRTNIEFVRM